MIQKFVKPWISCKFNSEQFTKCVVRFLLERLFEATKNMLSDGVNTDKRVWLYVVQAYVNVNVTHKIN